MASEYYIGEGLKIQLDISAEGFDQRHDSYTVEVYCNDELAVTYTQENLRPDGEGHWLLPLPTDTLPEGKLVLVVKAIIPDADFTDGFRQAIPPPIKLGTLKKLGQ